MLRHTSFSVSEITYKVGFNNVSYFIKCFHEYYGYSPGDIENRNSNENNSNLPVQANKKRLIIILSSVVFMIILTVVLLLIFKPFSSIQTKQKKTIAVLRPEINGNDPNSYHIESIMEAISIKLGLIEDLAVIPWTSVRKYENNNTSIPTISKELNAGYIVESGGFISEDKIHLTVTLVTMPKHKTIASYPYTRTFEDIFILQDEISEEVAKAIGAQITPEERERINKKPTENEIAYDYYIKGKTKRVDELEEAIPLFEKALQYDKFALAYAEIAITYFLMDTEDNEGMYQKEINKYADLAMSYDNQHDICLISKAYDYINREEYESAVYYLDKALTYNPNSIEAIRRLRDIHSWPYLQGRDKFLEYALMAIRLEIPSLDSNGATSLAHDYYRLAMAFRNAGFFEEAILFLNKSIEINPDNDIGQTLTKCEVIGDMERDYKKAEALLIECIQKDSVSHWVHGYLARTYYLMRDYTNALKQYTKVSEILATQNSSITYGPNFGRLAVICSKMGETAKSEEYYNKYVESAKSWKSGGRYFHLCGVYSYKGDEINALEQMKKYSEIKSPPYFQIRLFKDDPIFDNIRNLPEFEILLNDIETKFWKNHKRTKANLRQKGLL